MKAYYRSFQQVLRVSSNFLPWRTPKLLEGDTVYDDILALLSKHNTTFIVTDKTIQGLGLTQALFSRLDEGGYPYVVYDKVEPNPTIANVEEALALYHQHNCYTAIAFGGGSPMDCAKLVLTRVAKPKSSVQKLQGILKVHTKLRPLIAIPTTAGTGSETTVAAVVVDETTAEKYSISDPSLIPTYAALIPQLTLSLPPSVTATTGMDALVHAIEAYIGNSNTKGTEKDALRAVRMIHRHLLTAYNQGDNFKARQGMQRASFLAGKAFTRAYVGNVHAMAHALGGLYRTPHGLANAVILPYVLAEYGPLIYPRLANLADAIPLTQPTASEGAKALAFLGWIEDLSRAMGIPTTIPAIQMEDLDFLAMRAHHDANPLYPVPVIFSKRKFKALFLKVRGESHG